MAGGNLSTNYNICSLRVFSRCSIGQHRTGGQRSESHRADHVELTVVTQEILLSTLLCCGSFYQRLIRIRCRVPGCKTYAVGAEKPFVK